MVVSRSLRDSAIHLKVPVTIKGALVNNIGVTPHSVGQKEQILGNFQKMHGLVKSKVEIAFADRMLNTYDVLQL